MNWTKVGHKTWLGRHYDVVLVIALIKNNSTKEVVEYASDELLEEGELSPSVFNWAENNYSCDCNRRIFFDRTKGIESYDDSTCTDGGFSVNLKNALTGEIYYREFE